MTRPFGTPRKAAIRGDDANVSEPKYDDDGDKKPDVPSNNPNRQCVTMATVIPQLFPKVVLKYFFGVTIGLYILNQKHLLPRPLSAIVSKSLFWPTLPITVSRRVGKWMTRVDDTGKCDEGFQTIAYISITSKVNCSCYHSSHWRGAIRLCKNPRKALQ